MRDEDAGAVIAGLILLAMMADNRHPKGGPVYGPQLPPPPSVDQWAPALREPCAARGIPELYALRWIAMESGGNPCAIGNPAEAGPDGQPREVGLAQSYNPDDLAAAGISAGEVRAYCVRGRNNTVTYKGHVVQGFSDRMTRELTEAELAQQAQLAAATIARAMDGAARKMRAAGASWPERDWWALVKLQHNLPGLASGVAVVARALGRAPASWREFRDHALSVVYDPQTELHRADFPHELDIAERAAEVV